MKIVYLPISENKGKVHALYTDSTVVTSVSLEAPPVPQSAPGKTAELYINPQTGEMFYEYIDIPLSPTEQLLSERLEATQAELLTAQQALAALYEQISGGAVS